MYGGASFLSSIQHPQCKYLYFVVWCQHVFQHLKRLKLMLMRITRVKNHSLILFDAARRGVSSLLLLKQSFSYFLHSCRMNLVPCPPPSSNPQPHKLIIKMFHLRHIAEIQQYQKHYNRDTRHQLVYIFSCRKYVGKHVDL